MRVGEGDIEAVGLGTLGVTAGGVRDINATGGCDGEGDTGAVGLGTLGVTTGGVRDIGVTGGCDGNVAVTTFTTTTVSLTMIAVGDIGVGPICAQADSIRAIVTARERIRQNRCAMIGLPSRRFAMALWWGDPSLTEAGDSICLSPKRRLALNAKAHSAS
jgi:hypothetical protein